MTKPTIDETTVFKTDLELRVERLEKIIYPTWHNSKEIPMPLNKQVLVYLTDNTYSVARRLNTCIVVGHSVPVEDTILLWIEIPELPGGFTK